MRGIGVGSPEKLAAAHLDNDRTPDTLKQAGLGTIADDPSSEDPPRKIPEESLPRSNHLPVTERFPVSHCLKFTGFKILESIHTQSLPTPSFPSQWFQATARRDDRPSIYFGGLIKFKKNGEWASYSKSLGVLIGEAKISPGPIQDFGFSFSRQGWIVPLETLHLAADISPVAFIKVENLQ
jgi:hypothetical protein